MIAALFLVLQAVAAPVAAPPPPPATGDDIVVRGRLFGACGPRYAPYYIAPMGEPFRTNGTSDPMAYWFARADADHDGRLTQAELAGDALAFFATIDTDRSGELDPQEVSAYEIDVAPEVRLYQPGSFNRPQRRAEQRKAKKDARARAAYAAAYGAGTNASLNIPEPVASADLDIDRGVSRDEFARVAAHRFALLDTGSRGYLAYDTLARSPAQQAIDACYAREQRPGK